MPSFRASFHIKEFSKCQKTPATADISRCGAGQIICPMPIEITKIHKGNRRRHVHVSFPKPAQRGLKSMDVATCFEIEFQLYRWTTSLSNCPCTLPTVTVNQTFAGFPRRLLKMPQEPPTANISRCTAGASLPPASSLLRPSSTGTKAFYVISATRQVLRLPETV